MVLYIRSDIVNSCHGLIKYLLPVLRGKGKRLGKQWAGGDLSKTASFQVRLACIVQKRKGLVAINSLQNADRMRSC